MVDRLQISRTPVVRGVPRRIQALPIEFSPGAKLKLPQYHKQTSAFAGGYGPVGLISGSNLNFCPPTDA